MKAVLLVSLGGVLGSLLRHAISLITPDSAAGTLNANLIGVALAGYFLILVDRRGRGQLRMFLLPGFCGGLTTFSAITVEVVGKDGIGFSYLALTIFASLITIAVVIPFARATIKVKQ